MDPIDAPNPTRKGTRIFIEGGWRALVPHFEVDLETVSMWARYYELKGESAVQARLSAKTTAQRIGEGGFLHLLRMAIARRAQLYAKLFPVLQEPNGMHRRVRLVGFDPERIQRTFVPGEGATKEVKGAIESELREMGLQALNEREAL